MTDASTMTNSTQPLVTSIAGGPAISVDAPAGGPAAGTVPDQSPAEVAATVAAVRTEQGAWEALGPRGRDHG